MSLVLLWVENTHSSRELHRKVTVRHCHPAVSVRGLSCGWEEMEWSIGSVSQSLHHQPPHAGICLARFGNLERARERKTLPPVSPLLQCF